MKNNSQSIWNYFTDLGLYHDELALGANLKQKKINWTLTIYFLLVLGIFSRQISQFPSVDINFANLRWSVFFSSMIFGLAILPYVIRRISKRNPKPTLEHTLSAFGIGFFVDFANTQLISIIGKIF